MNIYDAVLGPLFVALVVSIIQHLRLNRKMEMLLQKLRYFRPHRHVNGRIIYPDQEDGDDDTSFNQFPR